MKKLLLFSILLCSLFIFQSCEKDAGINEQPENLVAPEIPPQSMLVVPTESMRQTEVDTSSTNPSGTYVNWVHAAVNLVVWNTITVVNMAIPTAAFGRAFNEEASYIGNNTFEWAYQYVEPANAGGGTYNISLTGEYINGTQEVLWTMTASKVGGFSDFVWYTGIVKSDLSEGIFTLNHKPYNPEPYITIDYQRNLANTDAMIRFTNSIPDNPGLGQYVEYRTESGAAFNRSIDVQLEGNNFLQIQVNEPAGNGRVKHLTRFNDDEWHCWDTNGMDINC